MTDRCARNSVSQLLRDDVSAGCLVRGHVEHDGPCRRQIRTECRDQRARATRGQRTEPATWLPSAAIVCSRSTPRRSGLSFAQLRSSAASSKIAAVSDCTAGLRSLRMAIVEGYDRLVAPTNRTGFPAASVRALVGRPSALVSLTSRLPTHLPAAR